MAQAQWSTEPVANAVASTSGTTIASSATETILFPNMTIPARELEDNHQLRIRATGEYSTIGSGTVTLIFSLRWGGVSGTLLCKTGTVTTLISQTSALWNVDILLSVRTNGASGTMMANGVATVFTGTAPTAGSATGAPAVAPMTAGGQTVPATASVSTIADTALSLTAKMGASDPGNTVIGHSWTVETVN